MPKSAAKQAKQAPLRDSFSSLQVDDLLLKDQKKPKAMAPSVAGPISTKSKTVVLSLDRQGLIQLRFREGGTLPSMLKGRFTNIAAVKLSLSVYSQRTSKEFDLDTDITVLENGGSISFEELTPDDEQDPE
jgi:hypothetical protein